MVDDILEIFRRSGSEDASDVGIYADVTSGVIGSPYGCLVLLFVNQFEMHGRGPHSFCRIPFKLTWRTQSSNTKRVWLYHDALTDSCLKY